jgi:hypothetical protein
MDGRCSQYDDALAKVGPEGIRMAKFRDPSDPAFAVVEDEPQFAGAIAFEATEPGQNSSIPTIA